MWDHPRLRGEYLFDRLEEEFELGSPPLTRGIPAMGQSMLAKVGITPAYAGNTYQSVNVRTWKEDHPRLRGEYIITESQFPDCKGSPPLTRGIHGPERVFAKICGITPAYAGNTLKESLIYSIFPLSATKFHLVSHTLEMS